MQTVKKYITVWCRLAHMAFMMQMTNRWSSLGWLGGKVIRLVFFLVFIFAIFNHVPTVAGYSLKQVALFFLTFNTIDIFAQLLLRGLYMIGRDIREGDLDFYLIHPVNTLFRVASNLVDFLDFLTLIPVLGLLLYIIPEVVPTSNPADFIIKLFIYFLLCLNGVIISFSL